MSDTRILVVDDEVEIADLVKYYLENENYTVCSCGTAEQALEEAGRQSFDLAVLDVMLPGMSGFELCRRIRESHTYPVIMLTARTEDMDKITGLTIGADDYVTKPFNPLELVARVKAHLRRCRRYGEGVREQNLFDQGGLVVNRDARECVLYDNPISLTPTEFDILWLLCQNSGRVVSSEEIFETVWGEKYLDSNNTVMVHIRRLREKLGEPPRNPKFIKTVWGVGYRLEKH